MKQSAIIAYDIVDNKKRRKVFRCLQSWKLSSQYSVFECQLSKRQSEELLLQLCDMIDQQQDKLLFICLEDDVRLYPIKHPKAIWSAGIQEQVFANKGLAGDKKKAKGFMRALKNLLVKEV